MKKADILNHLICQIERDRRELGQTPYEKSERRQFIRSAITAGRACEMIIDYLSQDQIDEILFYMRS